MSFCLVLIGSNCYNHSKKIKKYNLEYFENLSKLRWSLDEEQDLKVIKLIYDRFKPNIYFSWKKILNIVLGLLAQSSHQFVL